MTDHIIKAAKAAGGTTYTNRHYPGATACAFGPEALERFYAIAYRQGMDRAAEICDDLMAPPRVGSIQNANLYHDATNDCASLIRAEAHAQNQPKNVHDTGNVSKN